MCFNKYYCLLKKKKKKPILFGSWTINYKIPHYKLLFWFFFKAKGRTILVSLWKCKANVTVMTILFILWCESWKLNYENSYVTVNMFDFFFFGERFEFSMTGRKKHSYINKCWPGFVFLLIYLKVNKSGHWFSHF